MKNRTCAGPAPDGARLWGRAGSRCGYLSPTVMAIAAAAYPKR